MSRLVQLRAWKEAKTTVGGGDTGDTDEDSGDSPTISVMNPSGLHRLGQIYYLLWRQI